jgi:hypothetical protein
LSYKGASEPAEGDAIAAAAPVDNKAHDRGFLSVSEAECDEQLIQTRKSLCLSHLHKPTKNYMNKIAALEAQLGAPAH